MQKTSKKILFFGNERLATGVYSHVSTLQALVASDYQVAAVVVAQNSTAKSRRQRELEVSLIAKQHGIPLLMPTDLEAAKGQLAEFGAAAAVLIAYGKIVPPSVLELFPGGIINIHPSLLPLHRGPAPIENTILGGDTKTGVSLMRLSADMDAGLLYDQKVIALDGNETKQSLADQLAAIGVDMVLEHLPRILNGSAMPTPQDNSTATYDRLISKTDGKFDWTKPASRLEREVRAYAGWPRSRATIGTIDVIITGARLGDGRGQPGQFHVEGKQLGVYCGEGLLIIDSLIPAGKQEMPAEAFLAGYASLLR